MICLLSSSSSSNQVLIKFLLLLSLPCDDASRVSRLEVIESNSGE